MSLLFKITKKKQELNQITYLHYKYTLVWVIPSLQGRLGIVVP